MGDRYIDDVADEEEEEEEEEGDEAGENVQDSSEEEEEGQDNFDLNDGFLVDEEDEEEGEEEAGASSGKVRRDLKEKKRRRELELDEDDWDLLEEANPVSPLVFVSQYLSLFLSTILKSFSIEARTELLQLHTASTAQKPTNHQSVEWGLKKALLFPTQALARHRQLQKRSRIRKAGGVSAAPQGTAEALRQDLFGDEEVQDGGLCSLEPNLYLTYYPKQEHTPLFTQK